MKMTKVREKQTNKSTNELTLSDERKGRKGHVQMSSFLRGSPPAESTAEAKNKSLWAEQEPKSTGCGERETTGKKAEETLNP